MDSFYQTMNSLPSNGSKKLSDQRRHSSTFSSYYLNKKAKDVASLVSIEDRTRNDFILE